MNLETKITIYKFTPQVFTLTRIRVKKRYLWRMKQKLQKTARVSPKIVLAMF